MGKDIIVAPSILSSNFTRLEDEIKKVEDSGADMIHLDIMDGHFVPNITIGPPIVAAIRKCTELPLESHLMIEAPHRFIKEFAEAGSDIITFHAEAYGYKIQKGSSRTVEEIDEPGIREVINDIKGFGKRAGISLNPDSPFCIHGVLKDVSMVLIMSVHPGFGGQEFIKEVLPKIREARKLYSGDIAVDGGINDKNVKMIIDAGANVIVAGSYFFSANDKRTAVKRLRLIRKI